MILTISKDCFDATEYTSIYPWIPMECLEFKMEYSSYPHPQIPQPSAAGQHPRNIGLTISISYLSRCIDNLGGVFLPFVFDDPTKRILNRGVIGLHKVVFHKLYCQRRLSCSKRNIDKQVSIPYTNPEFYIPPKKGNKKQKVIAVLNWRDKWNTPNKFEHTDSTTPHDSYLPLFWRCRHDFQLTVATDSTSGGRVGKKQTNIWISAVCKRK